MRLKLLNIQEVSERHLCCGCGACAYAAPELIRMIDSPTQGRRPIVNRGWESLTAAAMTVCPGVALEHMFDGHQMESVQGRDFAWGPVLEVWEGYAADPEVRLAGSSGGAATALSLFAIEQAGMHGVLHIAARPDVPYLNHTVLSRSRAEMLSRTGSRYAPASPCDGLQMVEDAPAPCVFIGKPCDVAATAKAQALRPALDAKLGLTIAVFCAGTPSTQGTLEMLKAMGVADPATVTGVRYRGNGWPGNAVVTTRDAQGNESRHEMTYAESWGGILEKHRQWRCYVCVDHSGEFADIAVGDPWYKPPADGELGRSLLLVRTSRGRKILAAAIAAGYIVAERADPKIVEASQKGFPEVRGSVWGRLLICRLFGVATPQYRNMPMFRFWWGRLTLKQKAQSLFGTVKRIFRKRLRQRAVCTPIDPAVSFAAPHPSIMDKTFSATASTPGAKATRPG